VSSRPERAPDEPAILVTGVTKRFGKVAVLDGVDLAVARGEMVALAGPSGAGKSTLVHLLGALDTPDAGTITVDGIRLGGRVHASLSAFRREHIGIVFQLHNLVPRLTAAQNVELAMFGTRRRRGERRERAVELLERLDLARRADHLPTQLSGGERARVALARSLANEPPVLLADEPTGNLDDVAATEVARQLRSLATDDGVAVLVVSHDRRLNDQAHRLLRLEHGTIVDQAGSPAPP
jgi:ABC-type lipoprotein export system ATPase subunit